MLTPLYSNLLAELERVITQGGFRAGLKFLNDRVPHRYTVTYRFDGASFYAFDMVDKLEAPMPELFKKVPLAESFCQYTVADGVFKTDNSLAEPRLDGHIHQATVQSYIGLPLTNNHGDLYGTLCHIDAVPHHLTDDEHAFLNKAVSVLGKYLPKA